MEPKSGDPGRLEAEQKPGAVNDRSADLLLREHQEAYTMYRHSEDLGERRVTFFLTVTTAVIGALTIRADGVTSGGGGNVDELFYYFLVALLLFGLVTLRRLMVRNVASTKQLRAIARIDAYFCGQDPNLVSHLQFFKPEWKETFGRRSAWRNAFVFKRGGLAETVAVINAVLIAFFGGLAAFDIAESSGTAILVGTCVLVVAWVAQCARIKLYYDHEAERVQDDEAQRPTRW